MAGAEEGGKVEEVEELSCRGKRGMKTVYVRMEERMVDCEKGRSGWVALRREAGGGMVELNGRGKSGKRLDCMSGWREEWWTRVSAEERRTQK